MSQNAIEILLCLQRDSDRMGDGQQNINMLHDWLGNCKCLKIAHGASAFLIRIFKYVSSSLQLLMIILNPRQQVTSSNQQRRAVRISEALDNLPRGTRWIKAFLYFK